MPVRQHESIHLQVPGGGHLRGQLSWEDMPGAWAVVFVHGFGSVRAGEKGQALEEACGRHHLAYAAFDLRGHGESSGTLQELRGSAMLEDMETIRGALAVRGIRRLCLVGSSMGGWATCWFAHDHPDVVPACVLIAPALDFIQGRWASLSDEERENWRRTGRHRIRNEWVDTEIDYGLVEEADRYPLARLKCELRTPLLIFHGMRDTAVPHEDSVRFVGGMAFTDIELRLLRAGDHRLSAWKDEIAEAACRFFLRCTSQTEAG